MGRKAERFCRALERQRQRGLFLLVLLMLLIATTLTVYYCWDEVAWSWEDIWYSERPLASPDHFYDAIRDADKLVVRQGGFNCCGSVRDDPVLFIVTDQDELDEIRANIQFMPLTNVLTSGCACCGETGLDWYQGRKRIALTSLQHGESIRWNGFGTTYSGPFQTYGDFPLTTDSAIWIIRWLLGRGVTNEYSHNQVVMLQRSEEWRKAYGKEKDVIYTDEEETPFYLERRNNVLYNQPGVDVPYTGRTLYLREGGVKRSETNYLEGRKHGPAITYFWTGRIASEYSYSNGVLHGVSRWWHANGTKAGEMFYSNGVEIGTWVNWDEQSRISMKSEFSDGLQMRVTTWHTNGQVKCITPFSLGKRHGVETNWYESGKIRAIYTYENGGRISSEYPNRKE